MKNPNATEMALLSAYAWGHISWDRIMEVVGDERATELGRYYAAKVKK